MKSLWSRTSVCEVLCVSLWIIYYYLSASRYLLLFKSRLRMRCICHMLFIHFFFYHFVDCETTEIQNLIREFMHVGAQIIYPWLVKVNELARAHDDDKKEKQNGIDRWLRHAANVQYSAIESNDLKHINHRRQYVTLNLQHKLHLQLQSTENYANSFNSFRHFDIYIPICPLRSTKRQKKKEKMCNKSAYASVIPYNNRVHIFLLLLLWIENNDQRKMP